MPDSDPEPIEIRLARAGLPLLRRLAWVEIDVAALTSNLQLIAQMARGARVMPVVKADAYGHGMIPVARVLEMAGAATLCVATLDEAIALRDADLEVPILVLYPIPADGVADAVERGIGVAAGDEASLERLLRAAGAAGAPGAATAAGAAGARGAATVAGAAGPPRALSVELEIETGLGRGGIEPEHAVEVARRVLGSGARIGGVWSHLQETEVSEITNAQVERFEAALASLSAAGVAVARRHLGASAAILLGNVPLYDAVRPGLITYGLIPDELARIGLERMLPEASDLRPVLSIHARPVRVADLPAGHGVSYGPTWTAPAPSRIATLPIGYGDGWPRSLSNRAEVLVRGVRAAVVGNVAMDATMVDVSRVPGPPVGLDDEFVLIGRQRGAEIAASEVARWRTTNSWEVVTAMSGRLARVYDAPAGLTGARRFGLLEDSWLESSSGTGISATSRSMPS